MMTISPILANSTRRASFLCWGMLVVAAMILAACAKQESPVSGTNTGTNGSITGHVVDANTGLPIPGAIVSSVPPSQSISTDSLGRYSLVEMPADTYRISATHGGYSSGSAYVLVTSGHVTSADISLVPNGSGHGDPIVCFPATPIPGDGADVPGGQVMLMWNCANGGDSLESYDVYLGTSSPPTVKVASGLKERRCIAVVEEGKSYLWRVVVTSANGTRTEGPIWRLNARINTGGNRPPLAPTEPTPIDGATAVGMPVDLTWKCSDPDGDPITYDLYLGTSPTPTLIATGLDKPSFHLDNIAPGMLHYWRVVARDGKGGMATSSRWTFVTDNSNAGGGGALKFNGIDGWVEVQNAPDLNFSDGSFTLEGWIMAQPKGYFQWMFDKSNNNSNAEYVLGIDQTNRFTFNIRALKPVLYGTTIIQPGMTYHLAGVVDARQGIAMLYVNGKLEAAMRITGTPITNDCVLRIGRRDIDNEFLNGTLDELRIWNVARTADEISSTMYTKDLNPLEEVNLIAYWPFSEESGTTTVDATEHGHNGTLHGGVSWVTSPFPLH